MIFMIFIVFHFVTNYEKRYLFYILIKINLKIQLNDLDWPHRCQNRNITRLTNMTTFL